jgi:hypothetical protein
MWAIWITFIVAVSLVAVLNHAMDLHTFFLGPVIGVLMAVAFASMGSLMGRQWFAIAAVFALVQSVDPSKVAERFHGYGGKVLRTTLLPDQARKLQETLAARCEPIVA